MKCAKMDLEPDEFAPDEEDLYVIDEGLSALEAILRYSRSPIPQQRYAYLQGLGAAALHAADQQEVWQLADVALEVLDDQAEGEGTEVCVVVLKQLGVVGDALGKHMSSSDEGDSCSALLQRMVSTAVQHLGRSSEDEAEEASVQDAALTALHSLLRLQPRATAAQQVLEFAAAAASTALPGLDISNWVPQGSHASTCPIFQPRQSSASVLRPALRLLASCAWLSNPASSSPLRGAPDEAQGADNTPADTSPLGAAACQLVMGCAGCDADEEVQQCAATCLATLAFLLPLGERGPRMVIPVLDALASSPMWRTRQAAAAAAPGCLTALCHHTLPQPPAPPDAEALAQKQAPLTGQAAPTDGQQAQHPDAVSCLQIVHMLAERLGSQEVSQWVRSAAAKAAGPAICALPRSVLHEGSSLLALYTRCAGVEADVASAPSLAAMPKAQALDLMLTCATCLAQVVTQVGADRWHEEGSCLPQVYTALWESREPAVIQALAAGLPQLARCVGEEASASQLLPPLVSTLLPHTTSQTTSGQQANKADHGSASDQLLMQVAPQLVPEIAAFAGVLPEGSRPLLLQLLPPLVQTGTAADGVCGEWRVRMAVAAQLSQLGVACGPACVGAVQQLVLCVALPLCADPVAAVRLEASRQLGDLLAQLVSKRVPAATAAPLTQEVARVVVGLAQPPMAQQESVEGGGEDEWNTPGQLGEGVSSTSTSQRLACFVAASRAFYQAWEGQSEDGASNPLGQVCRLEILLQQGQHGCDLNSAVSSLVSSINRDAEMSA